VVAPQFEAAQAATSHGGAYGYGSSRYMGLDLNIMLGTLFEFLRNVSLNFYAICFLKNLLIGNLTFGPNISEYNKIHGN
jgi:hypothetical protein